MRILLVALLLTLSVVAPSAAAGFRFVDLLAGKTRPDIPSTPFYVFSTPSISGERVVFLTIYDGVVDGLWSIDTETRAVRKLAGLRNTVPGGVGRFVCLCLQHASDDPTPTVTGGLVAFYGMDAARNVGLYTVPVDGGAIRRIASSRDTAPDGSKFQRFGRASVGGSAIAFRAATGRRTGIFAAAPRGGGLHAVITDTTRLAARNADGTTTPRYYDDYNAPVIGRGRLFFTATGLFDPSRGANAVFRAGPALVVDHLTALAGGSGAHVRISSLSAPATLQTFAYLADEPSTGFTGIFRPKSSTASNLAFVTTASRVPGRQDTFGSFGGFGYDASGLAFTGIVGPNAEFGVYFSPGPGRAVVTVARQGGSYYKPIVGDRSISGGRIVFREAGGANRVILAIPR